MSRQTNIVAIARSWIGTPYVHQASARGAGTDCLGLVRGVWRDLYGDEPEPVPAYSPDWSEPQRDEILWRAAQKHLCEKPVHEFSQGDVLLFRMKNGGVAKHLGIVAYRDDPATFIHAYSGHRVTESPLSDPWRRKIAACFEFPVRRN
jgi:NlpC/P60 family putative phage cell wall peptidase